MVSDDLRIGGAVALPGRLRTDEERDGAIGFKVQACCLRPRIAARLNVGREPDATQSTRLFGLAQPFGKT